VQAAREIADSLRARLVAPCQLPEGLFQLDASIGMATFPADGADAEALLMHADKTMYAAKHGGRTRAENLAAGTLKTATGAA
jgi:GGDEF domain-containing protein